MKLVWNLCLFELLEEVEKLLIISKICPDNVIMKMNEE